jgi:lipopolysaccharide transport system ATP-binding protein
MLGFPNNTDVLRKDEFWAVQDVSFEVKQGEVLGIIGPNGSGKTTLLKMINGIFMPDKGRIEVNGRVGALIEVGAGFHPLLTGRENIYINGAILGMNKKEIDKKFEEIVEFADIGDFLDTPVKYYSSGMYVRLGFAVAIHCEPDILLVDEVLAVGDVEFQRKCFQKMKGLLQTGTSVILVSHSTPTILTLCKTGLFLSNAQKVTYGDIFSVVKTYNNFVDIKEIEKSHTKQTIHENNRKIIVKGITFYDLNGNQFLNNQIPFRHSFIIEITYHTNLNILEPLIWGDISKKNELISIIGGHFSKKSAAFSYVLPENGKIRFIVENQNLTPGAYIFKLNLRGNDTYFYENLEANLATFVITDTGEVKGFLYNRNFSTYLESKTELEKL